MSAIPLIRQGALAATTLFSVIVLAISADSISLTQQYYSTTTTFSALGVAVATISLVTLPVMFIVDIFRRGAFTSMIVVELVWLSILWILWVATAGKTVSEYNIIFPLGCIYASTVVDETCRETQTIEAFSFLNFIILLLYTGMLFVMALIAASRGQSVWLSSVKESFSSPAGSSEHAMTQYTQPHTVSSKYPDGPTQPEAVAVVA